MSTTEMTLSAPAALQLRTAPPKATSGSKEGPAWSKIAIGSLLSLGEGVFFGHALEQVKIIRQATALSYVASVKHSYSQRGLYSVMYRGFFPFGALQAATKGLPILFVESEVHRHLDGVTTKQTATVISGVCGGVAQGIFVAPTQRLKTLAMTYGKDVSSWDAAVRSVKQEGVLSLFRGTTPLAVRRGFDWGIRFTGLAWLRPHLETLSGGKREWHPIAAAFFGGALSAATLPLDNIIANMQKAGSEGGVVAVTIRIFTERGMRGFFNGMIGRILHSGYHTAFVAGGGTVVYEWLQARKANQQ